MSYKLLNELTEKSELWKIVVRVQRRWNLYDKANTSELFCVTMVLLDEEGTEIQASAIGKTLAEKFVGAVEEKKIYRIENFGVSRNTLNYGATTHRFKITFNTKTFVAEEEANIPLEVFTFKPIAEIVAIPADVKVDNLIDVIGFVKSMGKLEEYGNQPGKCLLRMILSDAEDNEIECVLFDQTASDAALSQMQDSESESALVAVINLGRVTWSVHNGRQIASSFEATRVYFNHDIPEVKELHASAANRATPLITQFTQSRESQRSRVSGGQSLHAEPKVTLDSIKQQKQGNDFVVACELFKFETSYDWWYMGCSKCKSKAKPSDLSDPNSPLYCGHCKRIPEKVEPMMKLTFTAKDETAQHHVTFWDEQATQLLGKTVNELHDELPEGRKDDAFPDDLRLIEGKQALLQLRRNGYNISFPKSSISVTAFAICEDLLTEFNCVAPQPQGVVPAKPAEINEGKASSCSASNNPTIDLSEDDLLNSSLDTPLAQSIGKGKRRIGNVARGFKGSTPTSQMQENSTTPEVKLLKTIKQEKLN